MGHLYRASLLANMIGQRFGSRVKLVIRDDAAAKTFLAKKGLAAETIALDISIDHEISLLNQMIAQQRPAAVIFDLLTQEDVPGYLPGIEHNGSTLISITDDSHKRELSADLVVNGNPSQIGLDYGAKGGNYLLGPEYFIMDQDLALAKRPGGKINDVFLTFGGSDHNDLVFKVLSALEIIAQRSELSFKLAVSSASGYLERLKERIARSVLNIELLVDQNGFSQIWSQVDLAITAGGNTLFERIASRLPGATICQLQRQMEIADKFEKLGVNKNIGFGPDLSETDLANQLEAFLSDTALHLEQYNNAPKVTDGKGLDRLADRLEPILKGGQ